MTQIIIAALVSLIVAAGIGYRVYLIWTAFTGDDPNVAMGMRCSGPSLYLRERFDLPDRAGCIVLRVSGSAEAAGIEQGYLMVGMNGAPITSGPQYSARFYSELAGGDRDPVGFNFVRPGSTEPVEILVKWRSGTRWEEDPNDPIYYFVYARADEGEHPDEQSTNYSKAIELAPGFDLAYVYRGNIRFYDQHDLAAARLDYERALMVNPMRAEALRQMALDSHLTTSTSPLQDAQHVQDAESYIRRAILADACDNGFLTVNVDCERDLALLADILMRKGDAQGSAVVAERALEFYAHEAPAYGAAAIAYANIGDSTRAKDFALKYLEFPAEERYERVEERVRAILSSQS